MRGKNGDMSSSNINSSPLKLRTCGTEMMWQTEQPERT